MSYFAHSHAWAWFETAPQRCMVVASRPSRVETEQEVG